MADLEINLKKLNRSAGPLIIGGLVAIFLLIVVSASCAIVEPGHAGVLVSLGHVEESSMAEGFHWKAPFVQDIELMDCRKAVATITALSASNDLQIVQTTVAINYRPVRDKAWSLFQNIGPMRERWEAVIIDPTVQEVVKAVTANYRAEDLVIQRDEVKQHITDKIRDRCREEGHLEIEQVSITNFQFSAGFDAAIEAKQVAEQQALRAENDRRRRQTEAQADRDVRKELSDAPAYEIERQAQANALAVKLEADAEAGATRVRSEAEAEALRRLAAAAAEPALRARFIEKWDGQLPRVVAGDDSPLQFLVPLGEESGLGPDWDGDGLPSPGTARRTPRLPTASD